MVKITREQLAHILDILEDLEEQLLEEDKPLLENLRDLYHGS